METTSFITNYYDDATRGGFRWTFVVRPPHELLRFASQKQNTLAVDGWFRVLALRAQAVDKQISQIALIDDDDKCSLFFFMMGTPGIDRNPQVMGVLYWR